MRAGLLAFLLAPALGQPLLLAEEEAVRLLYAAELLRAGLEALAEAPSPRGLGELQAAHDLWAGSLAAHPRLAAEVEGTLARARELARAGDQKALKGLLPAAQALLTRAQAALVPGPDPALKAALAVQMALGEGGVAEGYRAAFLGDAFAYRRGFFLLWQLHIYLEDLKPLLFPEARERAEEALKALRGLYPASQPSGAFRLPELAFEAAQDLVLALEAGLGVELLPRDLTTLLLGAQALLRRACEAQGHPSRERELWAAAKLFSRSHLLPLLTALEPRQAALLLRALEAPPSGCLQALILLGEVAARLGEE
ncbi:hypothetical protein [Thermus thermamylovorans]|uniref:Uncharacterized protein n=1 Tax=Thermus thermamylovorans TaxID=2509362 RepID=A0A4V2IVA4_9DEIN|nr:hypothetical protein [Thermus thermamylovorans]TBH21535.1 hypothetical protein ETP66_02695 [Thermus thermamylovorans]